MRYTINEFAYLVAVVLVTSLLLVLMMVFSYELRDQKWQKEAVTKGYAEYNSTNGNWQWKP